MKKAVQKKILPRKNDYAVWHINKSLRVIAAWAANNEVTEKQGEQKPNPALAPVRA